MCRKYHTIAVNLQELATPRYWIYTHDLAIAFSRFLIRLPLNISKRDWTTGCCACKFWPQNIVRHLINGVFIDTRQDSGVTAGVFQGTAGDLQDFSCGSTSTSYTKR